MWEVSKVIFTIRYINLTLIKILSADILWPVPKNRIFCFNGYPSPNAYYAITRTDYNTDKDVAKLTELVRMTGAIPIITDPVTHDYAVAGISHVPHLIASSLVNLVKDNDTDANLMKTLAAGGFKDITRIASSSAEMWSQICMTMINR